MAEQGEIRAFVLRRRDRIMRERGLTIPDSVPSAINFASILGFIKEGSLKPQQTKLKLIPINSAEQGAAMNTTSSKYQKSYPLNNAGETINEIGSSIERVMGGTSGIIYSIFCTAAYAKLKENSLPFLESRQWVDALEASITAISKYGGAKVGYCTLLDAFIPATSILEELAAGDEPTTALILSSEAAFSGAESTKNMQAQNIDVTYRVQYHPYYFTNKQVSRRLQLHLKI